MDVTANAGELERVFDVLRIFTNDGVLQFGEDSLRVVIASGANHAVLDLELKQEFFESYRFEVDKHLEFFDGVEGTRAYVGAHIDNIYQILNKLDGDESVTLEVLPEKSRIEVKQGGSVMSVPVIDIADEVPDIGGRIDLSTSVNVVSGELISNIQMLAMVDQPIEFTASRSEVAMRCSGRAASGRLTLEVSDFEGDIGVTSLYDEDILGDISRILKKMYDKDAELALEMDEEQPIRFSKDTEEASVEILVAPRLEEA